MRKAPFLVIVLAFLVNTLGPVPLSQADPAISGVSELRLPAVGVMVHLSPEFTPAYLQGMTIHPENALQFDFLIHKGDQVLHGAQKQEEYKRLVKYFLASLTIPDEDQWVNLSPYEKDRMIKDDFGKTEMGRDLLDQDYLLKQITSSLIYPDGGLGKKFWARVYDRAWREYHTNSIPVNTFNKVWIIPDQAIVYESGNSALILQSHLKVMLEEDYLSKVKHSAIGNKNSINALGSQIIREIILPELEKEVNEGRNFANLRQMYSGMVLATWYKKALKGSLLGKIYADRAKVKGVDQDPKTNGEIYRRYLQAFKKGVFNYIKEDVDKYTKETIPRKYFSGGFMRDPAIAGRRDDVKILNSENLAMMSPKQKESMDAALLSTERFPLESVKVNLLATQSEKVSNRAMAIRRQFDTFDLIRGHLQDLVTEFGTTKDLFGKQKSNLTPARVALTILGKKIPNNSPEFRTMLPLLYNLVGGSDKIETLSNTDKEPFIPSYQDILFFTKSIQGMPETSKVVENRFKELFKLIEDEEISSVTDIKKHINWSEGSQKNKRESRRISVDSNVVAILTLAGSIGQINVEKLKQLYYNLMYLLRIDYPQGSVNFFEKNYRLAAAILLIAQVMDVWGSVRVTNSFINRPYDDDNFEQPSGQFFQDVFDDGVDDTQVKYIGTPAGDEESRQNTENQLIALEKSGHIALDPHFIQEFRDVLNGNRTIDEVLYTFSPYRDPTLNSLIKGILMAGWLTAHYKLKSGLMLLYGYLANQKGENGWELYDEAYVMGELLKYNSYEKALRIFKAFIRVISQDQAMTSFPKKKRSFDERSILQAAFHMKKMEHILHVRSEFNPILLKVLREEVGIDRVVKEYEGEQQRMVKRYLVTAWIGAKYNLDNGVGGLYAYLVQRDGKKDKEKSQREDFRMYQGYTRKFLIDEYLPRFTAISAQKIIKEAEDMMDDRAMSVEKKDKATLAAPSQNQYGGIDFNGTNMNLQIKRDSKGVPLPLSRQDMKQLMQVQGFVPVIIGIKPAVNLPILSELQEKLR